MTLVLACVAIHAALVSVAMTTWWVPNLSIVGLVLAIAHQPQRWIAPAAVVACATVVWAMRDPGLIVLAVFAIAFMVWWCVQHWDGQDARVQVLLVAASVLAWNLMVFWIDGAWGWAAVPLVIAQPVLSGCAVLLVRMLVRPRRAPLVAAGAARWRRA